MSANLPRSDPEHGSSPVDSVNPGALSGPESIPPVNSGSPEIGANEPIDEAYPALIGLRMFLTAVRLHWTKETVSERKSHDTVIKAASGKEGAQKIRDFNVFLERSEIKPIRRTERLVSWHRQRRVAKMRKMQAERRRLDRVYGKSPVETYEKSRSRKPLSSDAVRWKETREKLAKADRGLRHDLGSDDHKRRLFGGPEIPARGDSPGKPEKRPDRMRHRQRLSELKAASLALRLGRGIERRARSLENEAAGNTAPGERRAKLIRRAQKRETRLEQRLEELRQIRPEAKRISAKKRQERQAHRHEIRVNAQEKAIRGVKKTGEVSAKFARKSAKIGWKGTKLAGRVLRGSAEVAGAVVQRTGREIRKHAVATRNAYQEGKSDHSNGKIQKRINNLSRRTGRGIARLGLRTSIEIGKKISLEEAVDGYRRGETINPKTVDRLLREKGVAIGLEAFMKAGAETVDADTVKHGLDWLADHMA